MDQIHTLQEVAEMLRLPYRSVRDAVFGGEWPHIRVSQRRRLMSDADIAEVLAQLHQEPTSIEPISTTRSRRANVMRLLNEA